MQDFNLVVKIEEEGAVRFEVIDVVTVEIGACRLSSPATEYSGIHGIANVTLAYIIATTSEHYRDCIEPSESRNELNFTVHILLTVCITRIIIYINYFYVDHDRGVYTWNTELYLRALIISKNISIVVCVCGKRSHVVC